MTWRVGLLVPSWNSVMEVDFYRSLPHDTTLHASRMYAADDSPASEERMLDTFVMPAAETAATVHPHVVVFGSTGASALRGKDYDRALCAQIGEATGAVPISVAAAMNQALRETRAARVAVITPYGDEANERIRASIEAEGIAVGAMHGMGLSNVMEIAAVTSEEVYTFVQSRIGPTVPGDALVLIGTNYRAMSAISVLKFTYDVPMVTSNFAALQAVKRELDRLRESDLAPAAR